MPDQQPQPTLRRGREGGRWINERPTSEDFSKWFNGAMTIDPKLDIEKYIGGVVLIPGVDSRAPQVTGFSQQGTPIVERREELSYVPYAKIETRIDYFWDLLGAHDEWVASVENVPSTRLAIDMVTVEERVHEGGELHIDRKQRQPGALTVLVHQLPEGFSIMSVPVADGYSHFLCATMRVSIYDRERLEAQLDRADGDLKLAMRRTLPRRTGRGTKQVPLLSRGSGGSSYADPNSLMKAETGALGRALGFAGIFVIPGSGVATAEDMYESLAQGAPPAERAQEANQGPAAPEQPVRSGAEQRLDDEAELRARAVSIFKALQEEAPAKAQEFGEWAHRRKLTSLGDAHGAMLRGVVRKLEGLHEEAEEAPQQQPPQEAPDVPATAAADEPGPSAS